MHLSSLCILIQYVSSCIIIICTRCFSCCYALSGSAGAQNAPAASSNEAVSEVKKESAVDGRAGDAAKRAGTAESAGAGSRDKSSGAAAGGTFEAKEQSDNADRENVPSEKAADKAADKEGDTEVDDEDAGKEKKHQDDGDAAADAGAGDAQEQKAAGGGKNAEPKKDSEDEDGAGADRKAPGEQDGGDEKAPDDDDGDADDTGADVNKEQPAAAGSDDKSSKDDQDAPDKPNGKDYNDVNYYDTNKEAAESQKDSSVDKELIPVAYADQDNDSDDKNADYIGNKQDRELGERRRPVFDDDDDDDDDGYDAKTDDGDNDMDGVHMHVKAAADDVKFDEHGDSELPSRDDRRSNVFRSTLLSF